MIPRNGFYHKHYLKHVTIDWIIQGNKVAIKLKFLKEIAFGTKQKVYSMYFITATMLSIMVIWKIANFSSGNWRPG